MNEADKTPDIVWSEPARLTQAALIAELGRLLRGRVREAYLFGSYARDSANSDSDVDIVLVAESERSWPDRGCDFFDLSDSLGPVDVIVYTPDEWQRVRADPSSFVSSLAQEWLRFL